MTMVTSAEKRDYTDQILAQHGVKTTRINAEGGEATFVDYGNALNNDIKNAILNGGFGENDGWDSAELAIQEDIANLFREKTRSNFQTNDLISMLRNAGYKVDSQYMSTSYIVDNKATNNHLDPKTNGAINILTITDKDGNNIVIADANGNAAIESEELFLNEILSGVVSSFDTSNMNYTEFGESTSQFGYMDMMNTYNEKGMFDLYDKLLYGMAINEEEMNELLGEEAKKLSEEEKAKKLDELKKKEETERAKKKAEEEKEQDIEEVSKIKYENIQEEKIEEFIKNYTKIFGENKISEEELKDLAEDEVKKYMEKNYTIV